MSLRVALVGCGKIADGHIEEIQKMPQMATVTGVCDLEPLMAEQLARRYAIPHFYGSYEEMLATEKPDVVHIATPPGSHLALARLALQAGCHIYVEKPFALTYEQAVELIGLADSAQKKVCIGYTNYFDQPSLTAAQMYKSGVLGDIVHIESYYGYNLKGPFGAAIMADASHWVHRLPGKLIQNNIDHLLYRVTDYISDEQPEIHASCYVQRSERYGDHRDELQDEMRVMIKGSGTSAYLTFSASARPANNFTRLYGTKNTLLLDHTNRTAVLDVSSALPGAFGRLAPSFALAARYFKQGTANLARFRRSDFQYFAGLNVLISQFYESIRQNTNPPISNRDILRISWMMDEIIRQGGRTGCAK